MKQPGWIATISVGILITGNIVGAGILGLPINTGLAGCIPSLLVMLVIWALMLASAIILADRVMTAQSESFDLPSLFGQALGPIGKWISVAANLLILYGLLVAYLSGGTSVITNLFKLPVPPAVVTLGLFVIITGLTLFGIKVVQHGNALFMVLMWLAFVTMIVICTFFFVPHRMLRTDWVYVPMTLPIMVTAFHFHNIIPAACKDLNWNRTAVLRALLIGTVIGLFMNIAWTLVVTGALPVEAQNQISIRYAFTTGEPATVPLSLLIANPWFTRCGLLFALLAIMTSYLANGTALLNFSHDMIFHITGKPYRLLEAAVTFIPPLVIALVQPDIFLDALNLVGGVGIVLLFGVLPGMLVLLSKTHWRYRLGGIVMVLCFLLIFGYEISQELGWLVIDAEHELWTHFLK